MDQYKACIEVIEFETIDGTCGGCDEVIPRNTPMVKVKNWRTVGGFNHIILCRSCSKHIGNLLE